MLNGKFPEFFCTSGVFSSETNEFMKPFVFGSERFITRPSAPYSSTANWPAGVVLNAHERDGESK